LAHDLVAKKCGVIAELESLDDATLKDYLDLFKKTLSGGSIEAIIKLTEVAQEKKKRGNEKKHKKVITNNEAQEKEKKSNNAETFKKEKKKWNKDKKSKKQKMALEGA
jgi:hypothetical protein